MVENLVLIYTTLLVKKGVVIVRVTTVARANVSLCPNCILTAVITRTVMFAPMEMTCKFICDTLEYGNFCKMI